MREPIRIPCEGSRCPGHGLSIQTTFEDGIGPRDLAVSMCRMCGRHFAVEGIPPVLSEHQRDDVLAMIDRGDYG